MKLGLQLAAEPDPEPMLQQRATTDLLKTQT